MLYIRRFYKIIITFFAISTFVILIFALLFMLVSMDDFSGMVQVNSPETAAIAEEITKGIKHMPNTSYTMEEE